MALRKPKKLKYPKKPKRSASPETKKKYLERLADIDKKNKSRESEFERRKKTDAELNRKIYG
ncbi:hypothetical protein DLM76_17195 [Leptospira yasudae]|uniref:hypothetical protein n=1 Tax=Leptospira yasudae TaxID=2202201 RepID=UPI000E59A999|nr:hypothetical protein [Leptospira yasudae]RHX91463.1 hypothetical protein DLM76_17195 [Leptospira yasudae]